MYIGLYNELIKDVSNYWAERMPMMCMEEAGELIQAISKYERKKDYYQSLGEDEEVFLWKRVAEEKKGRYEWQNSRKDLIDEIGDMYISLAAIMNHYNIDIKEVDERINNKLNKKY